MNADQSGCNLPSQGRHRVKLNEVLTIIRGVSYKKDDATKEPSAGLIPILRSTNIQGELVLSDFVYVPEKYVSEEQFLHAGDIVVAASSGSRNVVGKAAQLKSKWRGSFGTFCFGLRPKKLINPSFLSLFLQTNEYRHQVSELSSGVNINNLKAKHIEEIEIPLPPLDEQRRIVAEIETQFTRLDAGVAALKRALANLKRHRASVLHAACSGQLVPSEAALVRAAHSDRSNPLGPTGSIPFGSTAATSSNPGCSPQGAAGSNPVFPTKSTGDAGSTHAPAAGYESGADLLARILAERRASWSGRGRYKEPAAPDTSSLPPLPEGWCWATAEQISDENRPITYGVIKLGDYIPNGIPVLRSSDVRHLRLDTCGVKKISPQIASNYSRTFLKGGEILLTVRGTLGGVVVAPIACAGYNISREVAMIAPKLSNVSSCCALFIGSIQLQNWLLQRAKGIAYTGINIETLKDLPIPLPPLAEQRRIVAEVERQLSVLNELEAAVTANLARATRLRQAILQKAFN